MSLITLFVTCPRGIEGLLLEEIKYLGAQSCKETIGGAYCDATPEVMYKICLWSRLANRVYLPLFWGEVNSTKDCYDLCASFSWDKVLATEKTIAIDFKGSSDYIRNTIFGAQLLKDAIVDKIQRTRNFRLQIDVENPDCLIHARLHHNELRVFFDLSGHSLHQRGYRKDAGAAPIKENLAAALLIRAGWPKTMDAPLIDPCCGSGTLLIEAAMMATDKAPGLDRLDYGFLNWQSHDDVLWTSIQREALERHETALDGELPLIFGYDNDAQTLATAKKNIRAAGFCDLIEIETRDLQNFVTPSGCERPGLIIVNPPYGERLSDAEALIPLYQELGIAIKESDWKAAIFTSDPNLARATTLWSHKQYSLMNGKISCKLYLFEPKKPRFL